MVIGYGRVGKTLCYKLKQLNANVYAVDKDEKELARAKTYGINAVNINEINMNICKMDIVFNTVPALILTKERLILMSTETLILDLSSKTYGTDFASATKGLASQAIQYPGIPGKIAPDFEAEDNWVSGAAKNDKIVTIFTINLHLQNTIDYLIK